MQAKQPVSVPRRSQLVDSTVWYARAARFIVAEDAPRDDSGSLPTGIRGISVYITLSTMVRG
jgi:hypothetical protein